MVDLVEGFVDVMAFGAKGDGTTCDADAIQKAIDSFSHNQDASGTSAAGTILFPQPPMFYRIEKTIDIKRQVRLLGVGSPGGNAGGAVSLRWPDGVDGIVLHSSQSLTAYEDASGASLENLELVGDAGAASCTGTGIVIHARATVRNCLIRQWGGNGVSVIADVQGAGTNANGFRLDNVRSISNNGDGFYLQGGDANAGLLIGCDAGSNAHTGFNDASFLGNTYLGCQAASNKAFGYHTSNRNACHVFLGCYCEADNRANLSYPTLVIGGNLSDTLIFDRDSSAQWMGGARASNFKVKSQDRESQIEVGSDSGDTLLAFRDYSENGGAWPFRIGAAIKKGGFGLDWAGTKQLLLRLFNSNATVANGYVRDVDSIPPFTGVGGIGFDRGFTMGAAMKYRGMTVGEPTGGGYLPGDILYEEQPLPGKYVGWVFCEGAGWKPFGRIES